MWLSENGGIPSKKMEIWDDDLTSGVRGAVIYLIGNTWKYPLWDKLQINHQLHI